MQILTLLAAYGAWTWIVAALVLTGCSAGGAGSESPASSGSGAFPVTVKSALGSTTIDEKPKRIATWGWGAQDIVLALGIVPVAMPSFSYGGNADGVLPWDADRIEEAASVPDEGDLYEAQLKVFLDPFDPAIQAQARADGISEAWLEGARHSPIWRMAMDWRIAFPLHPEYRTLPMVWYVPPLSPIQSAAAKGDLGEAGGLPDVGSLRIPVRYLANLLTAGRTAPR